MSGNQGVRTLSGAPSDTVDTRDLSRVEDGVGDTGERGSNVYPHHQLAD